MKAGILTYHAAHNYGSNLQAYALQKTISKLGVDCEIINFRTERQKDQYAPLTKRKGFKYVLKNMYFLLNYKNRKEKYLLFERFIDEKLVKSKEEYTTLEELNERTPVYDYYISGSDQIWNTKPNDFDMAYYLPFVKQGKKIAYAPSFGPIGEIDRSDEIKKCLEKYDFISVREENGVQLVRKMIGECPKIVLDPTLLLNKEEWNEIIGEPIVKDKYIFFYTLFANKEMIEMCKMISRKMQLPIIISNISNQYEVFSRFVKKTKTGPLEFLSLIKNAELVLTSSFHGTVFSVLLEKDFFAINGMEDKRISTLLSGLNLEERSISKEEIEKKYYVIHDINYIEVNKKLENMRTESYAFLKKALLGD